MGEAVLNCEKNIENMQNEQDMEREQKGAGDNSSGVVKWERFLPRMSMRVLLIEADDSTRQIIAALLRKCNYKVACVSDGLKAWEILKARADNIDLILTEMDLPSISGYALLTLMTEHETCRNIPVIMMSSHDSISTVYKCMLRGASDYLVKPLRINEMRNLWQHVWRRQSSTIDGNRLQIESVAQQKEEGTAENNGASNHSSDRACARRNKDAIEKGSDAQSSCTKPDVEADNAQVETTRDFLQPQFGNLLPSEAEMQKQEMLTTGESKDNNATSPITDARSGNNKMDANIATETSNNNDALINSFKEAAGSNGALYGRDGGSLNCAAEKYDSSPLLGLSLRRCDPSGSVNQGTNEKVTLKLSESSAFSRYVNKPMQLFNPPSSSATDQHKEYDSGKSATCIFESDSRHHSLDAQKVLLTLATGQSEKPDIPSSRPEQRVFPVPLPVRVTQIDNVSNSYGSLLPPVFHAQSGLSQSLSANAAGHQQNFHMTATYQSDIGNSSSDWLHGQIKHTEELKFNSLEGREQISPVNDQSASSSFYNDTGYGSISGSSSNPGQIMGLRAASEIKIDGGSHRSSEREAALTKFRQKRKDRCFEKKVRYESRKKLAEQRPRVKGQFVRQAELDSSPVESKS